MRAERLALVLMIAFVAAGCATRPAPPVTTSPAFPEFVYPVPPRGIGTVDDAARLDRGWRFLQANDLPNADREFSAALKRTPALYPARAGSAYVALAGQKLDAALSGFDAVLKTAPTYVPALIGRGQTLLALNRDTAALVAFEAALAADASLTEVRRRVDVLRFRSLQELIETARTATAAGRLDEAAAAYERALSASPDTAFLHRDLGRRHTAAGEHRCRAESIPASGPARSCPIPPLSYRSASCSSGGKTSPAPKPRTGRRRTSIRARI